MLDVLNKILRVCHLFSCIPLLVLVVLTTADVVARYALASSVPDTVEISGLMLGILISLTLAPATMAGNQVRFDAVHAKLPRPVRLVGDLLGLGLAMVIFGLMAWQALQRTLYSVKLGEFVGWLEIPVWPSRTIFAFGCFLTSAVLLAMLVIVLRGRSGDPK